MLKFKVLRDGYAIIEDGFVYKFDKYGKLISSELPLTPEYVNGALDVDFASILSTNSRLELAIFKNNNITKYTSTVPSNIFAMSFMQFIKPICFLNRSGVYDGVNYSQGIFVVNNIVLTNELINKLQLKLVE